MLSRHARGQSERAKRASGEEQDFYHLSRYSLLYLSLSFPPSTSFSFNIFAEWVKGLVPSASKPLLIITLYMKLFISFVIVLFVSVCLSSLFEFNFRFVSTINWFSPRYFTFCRHKLAISLPFGGFANCLQKIC